MTQSVDLEKIKERIARLLAMAQDSSSPHEAAIAAGRARKLMDSHQIDLHDLQGSAPEEFMSKAASRVYAAIPVHLDILSVAVARMNDCQSVFERGVMGHRMSAKANTGLNTKLTGKYLLFKGYQSDVELAVNMYAMLVENIDAQCKAYLAGKGYDRYPVRVGGQFKLGAAQELCARLRAMTEERETLEYARTPGMTGTALVVATKVQAVTEHFGDPGYKTHVYKEERDADEERARAAGRIEGRRMKIQEAVE